VNLVLNIGPAIIIYALGSHEEGRCSAGKRSI
jgi:hypothetical protein